MHPKVATGVVSADGTNLVGMHKIRSRRRICYLIVLRDYLYENPDGHYCCYRLLLVMLIGFDGCRVAFFVLELSDVANRLLLVDREECIVKGHIDDWPKE